MVSLFKLVDYLHWRTGGHNTVYSRIYPSLPTLARNISYYARGLHCGVGGTK